MAEEVAVVPERRIVWEHTSGVMKGIKQIYGRANTFIPYVQGPFSLDGVKVFEGAVLVKTSPRAAYYREATPPEVATNDE